MNRLEHELKRAMLKGVLDDSLPLGLVGGALCVLALFVGPSWADDPKAGSTKFTSARAAVAEGNRLLRADDPESALQAYAEAGKLEPDAPEIPFVQGLAHYKAKRFDEARSAFHKAAAGTNAEVAKDAQYSLGTCDHAEALEEQVDAQKAISILESAMQTYHEVLAKDPNHKAARDANVKAANLWKQLKKQLEQQQQQQQPSGDPNNEEKEENEQQQQQQKQDQEKEENKEQPSQGEQKESEQKDESSEQGTPQEQEQKDKKKQEQGKPNDSQGEPKNEQVSELQESQAEQQEQSSREQAQRRLREMIQALQQRKKARPEKVEKAPVQPAPKDW